MPPSRIGFSTSAPTVPAASSARPPSTDPTPSSAAIRQGEAAWNPRQRRVRAHRHRLLDQFDVEGREALEGRRGGGLVPAAVGVEAEPGVRQRLADRLHAAHVLVGRLRGDLEFQRAEARGPRLAHLRERAFGGPVADDGVDGHARTRALGDERRDWHAAPPPLEVELRHVERAAQCCCARGLGVVGQLTAIEEVGRVCLDSGAARRRRRPRRTRAWARLRRCLDGPTRRSAR